ncbi:hypothetical protein [Thermoplasma sp. Kam2015]|uniref:hypothetical protein n=1 Tax=Thermoplasma sp. Kam2015 TaxID=2094122 RepID=UPI0012932339|nr:hypothetical protein [Thermoplasma sp. Kam2015]
MMSKQSTKGDIMQIRVKGDTYRRLLRIKGRIEEERGRPVSFDDAVRKLLEGVE